MANVGDEIVECEDSSFNQISNHELEERIMQMKEKIRGIQGSLDDTTGKSSDYGNEEYQLQVALE
jgi:hypothetical protein